MLPKTSSRWPPNLGLLSPLRARCDTEIPSERASASKAHSKPLHVKSQPSPRLFHPKPLHAVPSLQFFSTTPLYLKKSQRDEPNRTVQLAFARSKAADDNPYDFSALEADIASALDRLEDDLSKLKPGGRFNPDVLDGLRVNLVKGSKESIKLGDLAQVVPRSGRTIVVLVGEADYVKPITSALLSSPYSLNPVPAAHSPLELQITVPPATQESRKQTLAAAAKAGETAEHAVRQARAVKQKLLRAMELAKTVRPDDLKKARETMDGLVGRGSEDVKKRVLRAKGVLGG